MDRDKQLKRMVIEWNTNLLYDGENYSSDYSDSIFDISEVEAQSNSVEEIPLPDIDTEIIADLCFFGGLYCDKKTVNEYVFKFPSITQCEKPQEFALQILKADSKFKVNTYAMPTSVDMDGLISSAKLDDEAHIISFVKKCKHHVTCYYIRQEQYDKLQKIVKGINNCIVHTSFGYSVIILKLLEVQDIKNNISMNLSITLKYLSTEVRPYKVQLDWDKNHQLPQKLKKRLRVFTHVFREKDLSVAIAALINADETEFSWNRTCESNTSCLTEMESSEEEYSLTKFLMEQLKSGEMQKKRRKVQKSKKKKQKISRSPLLEAPDDSNVIEAKGNIKSLRKDTLKPHIEQKLSVDTKTEETMKRKKQKKISSMFQVKTGQRKSVASENDDSNCSREKLLSKKADKLVSASAEDNVAYMEENSQQPISEEKLSHPISPEQGSSMKKQRKISTMLRGMFHKSHSTIHNDDASFLLNGPSAPVSERKLPLQMKKENQLTTQEMKVIHDPLLDKLYKNVSLDAKRGNINSVQTKSLPSMSDKKLPPDMKIGKKSKKEKPRTVPIKPPIKTKQTRIKQTKQNLHQGHVKDNSDPFAFSSDNTPLPTVNIKQMLRDRATSTPLHKHQSEVISNVTDFEVSSISADEDSMRLSKLWKHEMYKAKKKRVEE